MNLFEWRKARSWTAKQAADFFDLSQPTISRLERGDLFPAADTMSLLVERTNGDITADDLLKAWEEARDKRGAVA